MNDKEMCDSPQVYFSELGTPPTQYTEPLNLGLHTIDKSSITKLDPPAPLKYVFTLCQHSQLWPSHSRPWTSIPAYRAERIKQVQWSLPAAELICSPDVDSGFSRASLPTTAFSL